LQIYVCKEAAFFEVYFLIRNDRADVEWCKPKTWSSRSDSAGGGLSVVGRVILSQGAEEDEPTD
jgi:hypothetical protein